MRVCDTLSTFFVENLVTNLLHQSRHVEIDAAGSSVRARARQMECRKTRFEPANEPVEAGFSLRAYHDVIKRKKHYEQA